MKKWFARRRPFAHGSSKNVFRKRLRRSATYPQTSYFAQRGGIVKVGFVGFIPANTFRIFWEMKIAHEIFPKFTATVSGFKIVKAEVPEESWFELHMKEVKLHKELIDYNNAVRKFGWSKVPAEIQTACDHVFFRNSDVLAKLSDEFLAAGLSPSLENSENVSLANPNKPVFLEPKIMDLGKLEKYVQEKDFPAGKKARLLRYVERYKIASDKSKWKTIKELGWI